MFNLKSFFRNFFRYNLYHIKTENQEWILYHFDSARFVEVFIGLNGWKSYGMNLFFWFIFAFFFVGTIITVTFIIENKFLLEILYSPRILYGSSPNQGSWDEDDYSASEADGRRWRTTDGRFSSSPSASRMDAVDGPFNQVPPVRPGSNASPQDILNFIPCWCSTFRYRFREMICI